MNKLYEINRDGTKCWEYELVRNYGDGWHRIRGEHGEADLTPCRGRYHTIDRADARREQHERLAATIIELELQVMQLKRQLESLVQED
jgi:hypothetical protein